MGDSYSYASSVDQNKAVCRRVFDEVLNEGRLDVIPQIYTQDIVDHDPLPGAPDGIEGLTYSIRGVLEGFPDVHVTIDDVSGHQDMVVLHVTWRGTRTGRLLGMPPSSKTVTYCGIVVFRLENRKIAERWAMTEILGALGVPERRAKRKKQPGFIGTEDGVTTYGMIRPILPGKLDAWRQLNAELAGPSRDQHRASRKRHKIRRELKWHQATEAGDVEINLLEADDLVAALDGMATSKASFDRWYRKSMAEITGVDSATAVEAGLASEVGFDWSR